MFVGPGGSGVRRLRFATVGRYFNRTPTLCVHSYEHYYVGSLY